MTMNEPHIMMLYKVELYLKLSILKLLKNFNLKEFNCPNPIAFVEAEDPDDACHKAIGKLMSLILKQDDSIETRMLCFRVFNDIKVDKVSKPK